jgi:hypothetical protein
VRDVRPTFSHLRRLVDERGIWQHAVGVDPDPTHGYCLDDATRAAIVMTQLAAFDPRWDRPLATCRRFIGAALAGGGGARNFMGADGGWLDAPHRGDHVGRAIWALGVLSTDADERHATWAGDLLARTVADQSRHAHASLHTLTYALLGVAACREPDAGRAFGTAALDDICARLPGAGAWPWPEPSVRYDAGDEQPLEAAAFAAAHAAAAKVTGAPDHAAHVRRALAWFHGDNRLATALVDDHTGACHDGLGDWTRNDNCGAESTIAYAETWLHAQDHCLTGGSTDGPFDPRRAHTAAARSAMASAPGPTCPTTEERDGAPRP